jgi:hypothetical protein
MKWLVPSTYDIPAIFATQSKAIEYFQEQFIGEMADGDAW